MPALQDYFLLSPASHFAFLGYLKRGKLHLCLFMLFCNIAVSSQACLHRSVHVKNLISDHTVIGTIPPELFLTFSCVTFCLSGLSLKGQLAPMFVLAML